MSYNIILHTTTACNYDCSYCDVIKDNIHLSWENREKILLFIKNNYKSINRFKFFGWEPLLRFKDIKYIINHSNEFINNNYEIVTNTTILNNEIWEYLEKYFSLIFFSIDSENSFNFEKVITFIQTYNLEKKLYFNLIISPGKEFLAEEQFQKLYQSGMKGFNILPVYFTKKWQKSDLIALTRVMKNILDLSLKDKELRLYGFTENLGEKSSLINESLFIDSNNKLYYSDFVSTYFWKKIEKELFIEKIDNIDLSAYNISSFESQKKAMGELESRINSQVSGQNQLHKLMDYFSVYLNKNNGK